MRRKNMKARFIVFTKNLNLLSLIREDIDRYPTKGQAFISPGFWVVMSYRFTHWLSNHHMDFLGMALQLFTFLVFNCDISRRASLGPGVGLFHPMGIFIGPMVTMGTCCNIGQHVFIGANREPDDPEDYPVLGDYVILGAATQVYGGIVVGDRVRVGPGAILYKDVPDGHIILSPASRSFKRKDWDYEKLGKKDW